MLRKLDSLRSLPIGGRLKESLQTGGQGLNLEGTFPPLDKVSTTGVRKFLAGKPSQDLQKPLWSRANLSPQQESNRWPWLLDFIAVKVVSKNKKAVFKLYGIMLCSVQANIASCHNPKMAGHDISGLMQRNAQPIYLCSLSWRLNYKWMGLEFKIVSLKWSCVNVATSE